MSPPVFFAGKLYHTEIMANFGTAPLWGPVNVQ